MILSPADQRAYPRCAAYIRNTLPNVVNNATIRNAINTTGQLNRAQLTRALTWGHQPTIRVVTMTSCGRFTPTPGNNVIEIATRVFRDFEAGRGRIRLRRGGTALALEVNILHELVHWGDNLDGVDRPGEEGDEFEMLVYGQNIAC